MLVYIKKRSYVCIRFCCTDWLGNSSILNEKPSQLQIVQWRATPSGSFREPVDYKGQERSNLVFSEFRRSLLYSKTFLCHICNWVVADFFCLLVKCVCERSVSQVNDTRTGIHPSVIHDMWSTPKELKPALCEELQWVWCLRAMQSRSVDMMRIQSVLTFILLLFIL